MALIEFDIQSINSVLLIINFIRGMGGMCPAADNKRGSPRWRCCHVTRLRVWKCLSQGSYLLPFAIK